MKTDYTPTIGIECHVQLNTATKLFARVSNDARQAPANTTVSAICFGLPGVLPYLNQGAVELAIKAGLALKAQINEFSKFDRKHYFYPDLPKGYQITQYDEPIIGPGEVDIHVAGETKTIGIERAHLEEDAGKLAHPPGANYSLVDLNRAGTPLLEIVSKPEIKSAAEAKAYSKELYLLMKFAGVSDVDLYHGHMRFDVNVSLAPKSQASLGVRAEVKNLNSFRAVERAAEYEIKRQSELLKKNQPIIQETRGWDEAKQKTVAQRGKEEAHDYRYFPEPDLPPLRVTSRQIETAKTSLKLMPAVIRQQLKSLGVSANGTEALLENIVDGQSLAEYLLAVGRATNQLTAAFTANWLLSAYLAAPASRSLPEAAQLKDIAAMYKTEDQLSSNAAYRLASEAKPGKSMRIEAKRLKLLHSTEAGEIEAVIDQVIAANPQAVSDVRAGQEKAVGYLVGQVMKSATQINPRTARNLLRRKIRP